MSEIIIIWQTKFTKIVCTQKKINKLFRKYLLDNVTDENHIIYLALEAEENKKYQDSAILNEYLLSKIENENDKYYILLDEIQKVEGFVPVLNGLSYKENVIDKKCQNTL